MTVNVNYDKINKCVEPHSTTAHKEVYKSMCLPPMASLRNEGGKRMKAIFETGGKQYYAAKGDVLYVEKLDAKEGDKVVFDKVLFANGISGTPVLEGAKVEAKVLKQGKAKKVVVFKFRAKKKYRRTQGHRQPYTKVEVTKISA